MWAALVTVAVAGGPVSAQAPAGWRVHTDPSQNAQDPDNTPNLTFAVMGKGFHVVSGPAGTFWHPSNMANGSYVLRGKLVSRRQRRSTDRVAIGRAASMASDQGNSQANCRSRNFNRGTLA
mgnify:CR=1 FL=1